MSKFRDLKVGDRVWTIQMGWDVVTEILTDGSSYYPIRIDYASYTLDGKFEARDKYQSLYLYDIFSTKELDYEILEACPIEGTIYSVKRVSDGEVFTIGDRANSQGSRGEHTIRQFRVKQKCFGKNFSGNYTYDGINRIWVDWEEGCGGNWLESTEKVQEIIFLTHDGKDIFEGDPIWYVNKNLQFGGVPSCFIATPTVYFRTDLNAYFLTEAAALDYVKRNKVLFTTEDGYGIKHGDTYYFVNTDFSIDSSIANFQAVGMSEKKKYFSTKAAAENYLVQNSKALSIEDFCEFVCWGGSDIAKYKRLKRLVKERLNLK